MGGSMSVTCVPVGAVLAYAGQLSDSQLQPLGWYVCRGQSMQKASFDELFNVIGTLHGGDGISLFKLPDYQGRFLRGCDHGAGRDPDAAERTAPASGGASGDSVGSVQGSATGAPLTPFTAQVPHAPNDYHYAFGGCSTPMLWWGSDPVAVNSSGGGDHETRPVNGNVNFIIKVNSRAELPLGVVVPLAGTNAQALAQNWLFCDGSSRSEEH